MNDNRFAAKGFVLATLMLIGLGIYQRVKDNKDFRATMPIVNAIDSTYKSRTDSLDHTVLGMFGDSIYFVRKDSMIRAHDYEIDSLRKIYENNLIKSDFREELRKNYRGK